MSQPTENGIVNLSSPHTVLETLARLEAVVRSKGIPILAMIDHSGAAAKVGLQMEPTKLLIFGNAKAGTPLMIASPSVALDLPLKALVWQDRTAKSGSLTTALTTLSSATISLKTCCQTSPASRQSAHRRSDRLSLSISFGIPPVKLLRGCATSLVSWPRDFLQQFQPAFSNFVQYPLPQI